MGKLITIFFALLTVGILLAGCTKPNAATGNVVFYQQSSTGSGQAVTVTINGTSAAITQEYISTPGCGAAGCATFNLDVGTYSYTATQVGSSGWSGTVNITEDGCIKQLLK